MIIKPSTRGIDYKNYILKLCIELHAKFPNWTMRGPILEARIQSGQWVCDCPDKKCNGSIIYEPGEPYFCHQCLNRANNGYAYPVMVPDQATRLLIEKVLMVRPLRNRNWYPSEEVQDLLYENKKHQHELIGVL